MRSDVLLHHTSTQGAGNLVTLDTVPAGEVWLVKTMSVCNRVGATATILLQVLRSGTSVKWFQQSIASSTPAIVPVCFFVAEGGDVLKGLSTVAGSVDWGLYGARLVV